MLTAPRLLHKFVIKDIFVYFYELLQVTDTDLKHTTSAIGSGVQVETAVSL